MGLVSGKPGIVKAKCKVCGQEAPSDSFKLHYQYRAMVCPNCYSGRTKPEQPQTIKNEPPKDEPKKPVGWDADDEYIEKMYRMKKQEISGRFEKIPGTALVRYNCHNCKYQFKYNPFKKQPFSCPYCNAEVPKVSAFNLF